MFSSARTLIPAVVAGILLCAPLAGPAAESVPAAQAVALLKNNKALWSYLGSTLEFHAAAKAVRVGPQWKKLGGAFIGPYQVAVKPKGEKNFTLTLTIETEQKFLDADGRELAFDVDADNDDIFEKAVKVEETVTSVSLTPGVEALPAAPVPEPGPESPGAPSTTTKPGKPATGTGR